MLTSSAGKFTQQITPKSPLIFCDMTLREGEQTPGVSFTLDERKELVRRLDEIGVQQVQLYNCWGGKTLRRENFENCKALCAMERRQIKTEIINFYTAETDVYHDMIDLIATAKPDVIHTGFVSTQQGLNQPWTEAVTKNMCERVRMAADYIKGKGFISNISFLDVTRADEDVLHRLIGAAVEAGADRVRLADTVGLATPDDIRHICAIANEEIADKDVTLGLHTHNDFGIGAINMLEGVRYGATLLDTSVNGLGERCGNAAMAEIAIDLEALYHCPTGLDLGKMMSLSKYVERISGVPIPDFKPFVGKYAFSDSVALHIVSSSKDKFAYQGIDPEEIGSKRIVIFGKGISPEVIKITADKAGRDIPESLYPAIIKSLYNQEAAGKGVVLLEKDFWRTVDSLMK